MPAAFIYLLKLSVSLAVVFLFYQLVLRRLTFYTWNRWYLLGYSLLCFFIPLIDITPALHQNELSDNNMVEWIPLLYSKSITSNSFTLWNILSILIITGMLVMTARLIIQLFSFRRMMKKAELIDNSAINLYQVNEPIIPFSFGNAVFINRHLHTEKELEEIIRHEFVHVKQHHSIDIIFSEILCLFNWFNPFAWLLRSAIRQNLEFLADRQVLENGVDKKQYQYLLLKVIGDNQFSIAQKFNFSSLKKRIAMMNKNKSAKMHLLRFLFLLPVLAVVLVSFRKEIGDTLIGKQKQVNGLPVSVTDTVPEVTQPNSKGYIINVRDKKGECLLVIKNKSGVEVKRLLLTEWNKDADTYEAKYGEIPPPPPPPPPPAFVMENPMPAFLKRNPDVKDVGWVFHQDNTVAILHISKKDGNVEKYDLSVDAELKQAEKKYGSLPYPPPPPPPPPFPPSITLNLPSPTITNVGEDFLKRNPDIKEISSLYKDGIYSVHIQKADGTSEYYNLSNKDERRKAETKYGVFPSYPSPPPANADKKPSVNIQFNNNLDNVDASLKGPGNPYDSRSVTINGAHDNVIYILDGVEITKAEMDKLKPNTIESVNVLKGNSAVKLYGENGRNGVIIIKTKNSEKIKSTSGNPNTNNSFIPATHDNVIYILDGVEIKKTELDNLKPERIESVNVLKGDAAISQYGEKGRNGVIIIKTKNIEKAKPTTQTPFLFPAIKNDGC